MHKYLKYFLLTLFVAAIALGIYQWQFRSPTMEYVREQNSGRDSLEDYYNQPNPKIEPVEVTFLAVGDIMLSRNVAGTMSKAEKDSYLPFRGMEEVLTSTDFNFGNLESPYSGRDDFNPTGSLVFNAPTWTIRGLAQYNFKVLSLANNHAMDQDRAGLVYTKQYLAQNFLAGFGTGATLGEAWQGAVYETKGIRVGFIGASYSSINDNGSTTNNFVARIEDVANLKKSISNMRARADFIVAAMHAGTEYTREPNQQQIDFAHAAIDNGADIVIGAHSHWPQTIEVYKGKHIFYGLGNFIFDQEWSQETKEGLTLKITLSKPNGCVSGQPQAACSGDIQGSLNKTAIKHIEMIPIIIENYSTPRPANDLEKAAIFKKINITNPIIK